MLTIDNLQNFYERNSLFSVDLAMTFMRKFNGNIDLINHIYQYIDNGKKRKYYYNKILKYSNIIINIGNAIISKENKFEFCESFINFTSEDLYIVSDVIIEILSELNEGYRYVLYDFDGEKATVIIKVSFMSMVRFCKVSFYIGRLATKSVCNTSRKSTRNITTTFNIVKKVNI